MHAYALFKLVKFTSKIEVCMPFIAIEFSKPKKHVDVFVALLIFSKFLLTYFPITIHPVTIACSHTMGI